MSNTERFKRSVKEQIEPMARFEPHAYMDRDGDCVEFLATAEPYYAERLDKWVTIYIGMETQLLVGAQVKRVSKLLEAAREYRTVAYEIKRGKVKLSVLIKAAKLQSEDIPPQDAWDHYDSLVKSADEHDTEMELVGCS